MSESVDLLKNTERFAERLPGFRPRESQIEMAGAVDEAIQSQGSLIVEAETGTGKTLAYLVPALLADGPTLVSTGTKSLQDQLYFKDLPLVKKVLGVHRSTALLKGRSNYLCPYHLEVNLSNPPNHLGPEVHHQMVVVSRWAERTKTGDLAELKELPEDAPVWPFVSSTRDNCLGKDCPKYDECPLMKAREKAQKADLVVINHHLFFANAALKEGGITPILPSVEAVVFDEAHQLPDVAATFFGRQLSARQLKTLANDVEAQSGSLPLNVSGATKQLKKATDELHQAMGGEGARDAWDTIRHQDTVQAAMQAVGEALEEVEKLLEPHGKASHELENCLDRCIDQQTLLAYFRKGDDAEQVFWYETFTRSFLLHATPLSVAGPFSQHRGQLDCAWIFTSATLSVAGKFKHYQAKLGLSGADTLALPSPFDFRHQSLLYVPDGLPAPNDLTYTDQLVEKMIPVIEAAGGRTFFLFTSHRALKRAAELLENKLPFPLLVQNTVSRRQLLDDFRRHGNAVLLGTQSFWEGIDVRGDALSCVIIDKLPFASPGDPVVSARIAQRRSEGGNPFMELQLPSAILTLRQGVGRLIRDVDDTGLLVLADPRVVTKGYGKQVLDSLPPMPRTRKLDVVTRFFRVIHPNKETSS